MQSRNPLASLVLLALLSSAATKRPPAATPAPDPTSSFEDMLVKIFGSAPRPTRPQPSDGFLNCLDGFPIGFDLGTHDTTTYTLGGSIPRDIAGRAGMNEVGFDHSTAAGRVTVALAFALANLRELGRNTSLQDTGPLTMADKNVGAALAAISNLGKAPSAA